ncbi:hypothetical protein F2Q69_00013956 [Brassica cretica]|uniref:Uncharacterized protein n=1 Tax=Brassica cretica TaxID=69181 RepID=A0A8S9R2Y7_BRACR|nr:hypothetical protein F2Q69_00013956 [Brassica cretica]
MSSRKGSSKRNSSSHSSSGASSANEVITPKEEFEAREVSKRAPYAEHGLSRLPHDSQGLLPDPKWSRISDTEWQRECEEPSGSQLSVPALQHWLGVLILSYELGMDLNLSDFEGFWFTRGTGIDGSYRMAPKKGMAIIQGHTSHPKAWFERFSFVRIDGECVEESYLHLFRQEWNFTRDNTNSYIFRFDTLKTCEDDFIYYLAVNRILPPTPADLLPSEIFSAAGRSYGIPSPSNGFERQRIRSRKGKGVASENVLGNLLLPEWNPGFSPGERSGTSEVEFRRNRLSKDLRISKRNSSSHSSSGDSSANEVIAQKEECEVEEEAKDAYYKALCGLPPPSQDIPIPKRPVRPTTSRLSGTFTRSQVESYFGSRVATRVRRTIRKVSLLATRPSWCIAHWLGMLISSYELGMDLNPGDFEGFWFTRGTGIDGSYRMVPKKGMAIIQGHSSHPKAWFERFFFVRIDGESVEEIYLHLFRREWNFTRGSFRRLLPIFLPSAIFSAAGRSSGIPSPSNGFEVLWSSIDLEPSLSLWTFRMT